MRNITIFSVLLLVAMTMSSCWTTNLVTIVDQPSRYQGNIYKDMVGMTKAEIINEMGDVPERSMTDGRSGEIIVYENRTLVTHSEAYASLNANSGGRRVIGYDNFGNEITTATSQTNANMGYSSSTTTRERKLYANFFIGKDGKCYKVQTNVGDIYSPELTHNECVKVANPNLLFTLIPPITITVGIPVLIWYLVNRERVKPCD